MQFRSQTVGLGHVFHLVSAPFVHVSRNPQRVETIFLQARAHCIVKAHGGHGSILLSAVPLFFAPFTVTESQSFVEIISRWFPRTPRASARAHPIAAQVPHSA